MCSIRLKLVAGKWWKYFEKKKKTIVHFKCCRTNSNITLLANVIYDMAFSLRSAGSKELLLHQKVPSTYLALEDVIASISSQMRASGIDPVLNFDRYKEMVNHEMVIQNHKGFR